MKIPLAFFPYPWARQFSMQNITLHCTVLQMRIARGIPHDTRQAFRTMATTYLAIVAEVVASHASRIISHASQHVRIVALCETHRTSRHFSHRHMSAKLFRDGHYRHSNLQQPASEWYLHSRGDSGVGGLVHTGRVGRVGVHRHLLQWVLQVRV